MKVIDESVVRKVIEIGYVKFVYSEQADKTKLVLIDSESAEHVLIEGSKADVQRALHALPMLVSPSGPVARKTRKPRIAKILADE